MSRRRRGESAEAPEQEQQPAAGDGPQVKVVMSGSADEVADRLKGVAAEPAPEKPRTTRAEEIAESNEQFFRDLSNPAYTVKVKRLRPKMWQGQKLPGEVWASELPLQFEEIKSEVTQLSGGGTYKVAVVDPSTDKMVSAKNFEVEGDPTIEASTDAEIERIMMAGGPKDSATVTEESLDRRARVSAKLLEVESIENQLHEAREQRTGGKKTAPDDGRINDLERRLTESKHQAELEARDRRHAEEMRELKEMIKQNAQAKPTGASDPMMILLDQMREDRKQSQAQFNSILTQMKDDKLNAVLEEVKAIKNKPQQKNDMVEMAESMLTLKKVFGWDGGDDDDDENDPDDDRPWWQKALDKLGDKLTPKVIDKLFSKLDGLETSKGTVTKDEFMKLSQEEIDAHAAKIVDEEIRKRLELDRQKQAAALPPPAPKPESPPPPPGPAASLPPEAPTGAPAAPAPAAMSLAQKLCQIAAGAIAMLEHELELRPRNYEWPYEFWDRLPEDLLDRVFVAPNHLELFEAFRIEGVDAKGLDAIKARISANPKMSAWLKLGFDDLISWKKKSDQDPSFDPGADEDEPEQDPE